MSDSLTLFAGTANPDLAMAVARELGVPLGGCAIEQLLARALKRLMADGSLSNLY